MGTSVEAQADYWLQFSCFPDPKEASEEIFDRAWGLYDAAYDDPTFAWEVIKNIIRRYPESEVLAKERTGSQESLGNLGAGPLETLLGQHGEQLFDAIAAEARCDSRVMWTLSCVWQNFMSDELWLRVQQLTGKSSVE